MSNTAFITGITGQDGAYLAQFLLNKGYKVYGGYRRTSSTNFWRLEELGIEKQVKLIEADLQDTGNLIRILKKIDPQEVYNLAAQSFVAVSFEKPMLTSEITGLGVTNILEAIRIVNPEIRFYQASSSEMFGMVQEVPQKESTPFYPRSPYAISKLYGHWMTINYRESYDIFASSGILFNHESPLRGIEFVTRKITDAVSRIYHNKLDCLELGNLDAKRDWGFAKEYVEGMWMMLQADKPDSFVLATNETHTIREFVEESFKYCDMQIEWSGSEVNEVGIDSATGKTLVKVNPDFFRPAEVASLTGDYAKAREVLGWQPETTFKALSHLMMKRDLERHV